MANILTSSIEVPFSPDGGTGSANSIVWENDDDIAEDDIRKAWVRLYPTNVPIVESTSGILVASGRKVRDGESYVVFNGSRRVSSPYPYIRNTRVTQIGQFYGADGEVILGVTIVYDPVRQEVVSSSVGYGIARLEYTVDYTSYLFTFDGIGCPDSPFDPIPTGKPFKDSVLIGIDPTRLAIGTHNMDSPACETKSVIVNRQPGAKTPTIDLMIDPEYPVSLGGGLCSSTLCQGCRIRHIPAIASTVKVNAGSISEINPGTVNFAEVNELVLFSGSSSTNLGFQAHSKPAFVAHGTFRNKWGSSISPEFRGKGERAIEVDRPTEHTRKNSRPRTVSDDEVVCVDSWGNTIEVFGVVEATYVYSYRLFEVKLAYNSSAGAFETTFITALRSGDSGEIDEPATLAIQPNTMKGET